MVVVAGAIGVFVAFKLVFVRGKVIVRNGAFGGAVVDVRRVVVIRDGVTRGKVIV